MKRIALAERGLIAARFMVLLAVGPCAYADANGESLRTVNVTLAADDVIPTGNDWIALPSIHASDGALQDFNVISMRYRGLLEVAGVADQPLMRPFIEIAGQRRLLSNLRWSLQIRPISGWVYRAIMKRLNLETQV